MMSVTYSSSSLLLLLNDGPLCPSFYVGKLGLVSIEGNSCDSFDVKALVAIDAIVIVCGCSLGVGVG